MIRKYFLGASIFSAIAIFFAGVIGYHAGHSFYSASSAMFIALTLGALEIALSFDNAIINAKTLKTMSPRWRRRFLTWGMIIAVFGMRALFPLIIVSIAGHIGPIEALHLAISDPTAYEHTLSLAHVGLAAFGGSFLMLVGLRYFFDEEKREHWVAIIEKPLKKAGRLYMAEMVIVLGTLLTVEHFVAPADKLSLLIPGVFGVIAYAMLQWIGALLEDTASQRATTKLVSAGLSTFVYLEVLDATFSFDGVIGAFAISKDIFIIALGLSIGAMFVRSLTLMFVDRGTLAKYKYLEHGAFWAILGLSLSMFAGLFIDIPDHVTGLLGIVFIGLAFASSLLTHEEETK